MFANIQKKLLLTHPLLWNSKIVLFSTVTLLFHILFFLLGYSKGEINFTDSNYFYDYGIDNAVIIFTSVLISILLFIVWLVYYSRNNAFKSFYPKGKFSLYKEWLLILLFCGLNFTYPVSFFYAKDLKARNYYSEEELVKRLETISLASLFLEGPFRESNFIIKEKDGKTERIERDTFQYANRNYSLKSLLNKRIQGFTYFTDHQDSLMEKKAKLWLVENKKDSVQWLFKEFFKISKEHGLSANITPEKWLDLVYGYPEFTKPITVGKTNRENDPIYNYYEGVDSNLDVTAVVDPESEAIDTISKTIKIVEGQQYIYSKYYVPYNTLSQAYGKISNAYQDPDVNVDFVLSFIYLSLALSLCVFSFKITSGRNWLIAFVSLGVIGIVIGIFSILINGSLTFPFIYVLLFLGLLLHFAVILKTKQGKGISGITINQILWLLPGLIPILYTILLDILKRTSGYYEIFYSPDGIQTKQFPEIEWLEAHFQHMLFLNLLFIFIFILLFSMSIKRWKGLAES